MEYDVIYETAYHTKDAIKSLVEEVNKRLQDGWKTEGGISVSPATTTTLAVVAQAMTRSKGKN